MQRVLHRARLQMSGDDGYRGALAGIRVPLSFLRAPRGLLDETPPLYPHALVASAKLAALQLGVAEATDVNHYTIVMSDRGADQVAAHTLAAVSAS